MTTGTITSNQGSGGEAAKLVELQRELYETKEQLRATIEALEATHNEASVGAWEYDLSANKVAWSDRLKEMLGIADGDPAATSDTMLTRIHPDNAELWITQCKNALTLNTPINMEVRLRRNNRIYIWLHLMARVRGGNDGTPRRLVGSAHDISYRKNAELDRTQIKERFELALQSLSVGIWDWNLVERQLYWSPKYRQLLGITDPECRSSPAEFERRMHPDDSVATMAALRAHIREGIPFDAECRLLHQDGHYLWTRICGVTERNAAGKALRMVGSVDDISARKEAQQQLLEREARLRNMFDHAIHGLITINSAGIVQSYNPACEKMFGYPAAEVVGQDISLLMSESFHASHIGAAREVEGRRRDGSLFPMEVFISQFEASGETLFSAIVLDITERKEIERMKNEFISIVSHELRTPLTSIRGSLGLMAAARDVAPDRMDELLNIARRNSELLMVLINDILDIEKLESGTMRMTLQPVDLNDLLADAVSANSSYASRFDVTLRLRIEADLPPVSADPDRLLQVIGNLLSNAAKFTRPGTVVDVRAERAGKAVRISVRDHGKGVPDAMKPILFEKFSQADPSNARERAGTGLGLAIARHFARLMKGDVDFTSQHGKGSTFFIDLPVAENGAEISGPPPRAGNGRRRGNGAAVRH